MIQNFSKTTINISKKLARYRINNHIFSTNDFITHCWDFNEYFCVNSFSQSFTRMSEKSMFQLDLKSKYKAGLKIFFPV